MPVSLTLDSTSGLALCISYAGFPSFYMMPACHGYPSCSASLNVSSKIPPTANSHTGVSSTGAPRPELLSQPEVLSPRELLAQTGGDLGLGIGFSG